MYFFFNLSIKVPPNCENYMKLVATYGNFISKCPGISEKMAQILAHMVLLNRSYSKMILYHSLWITLYTSRITTKVYEILRYFSWRWRHLGSRKWKNNQQKINFLDQKVTKCFQNRIAWSFTFAKRHLPASCDVRKSQRSWRLSWSVIFFILIFSSFL